MSSNAIQSAIERAKMVAAKLNSQIPSSGGDGGGAFKRSLDTSDDDSNPKKFASISDAVGAQLAALKAQQIIYSEDFKVPDKLVGLVIGRGGEQIIRLQNEAGCKVTMAPDQISGAPERIFKITGSRETVQTAKRMLEDIIRRGPGGGGGSQGDQARGNQEIFEMRIPGNKCGLVIGKSGETIKRLSEQYGVKMVVVQETNSTNVPEKPLRITGDADKVQRAKEAVMQLIADQPKPGRDGGGGRGGDGGKYQTNDYGSSVRGGDSRHGGNDSRIKVPGDKAGIVIGKGGDTIKDINSRTGAYVQIDKNFRSEDGSEKMFIIKGTYDQIQYAQQLIYEKITGIMGSQPPPGYFGPDAIEATSSQYSYSSGAAAQHGGYGAADWSGYAQQQAQTGGADASSGGQTQEQIAQAWAAYYQYYQQPHAAQAQATAAASPSQQQQQQAGGQQQDYSQAWVEYYRSMGMHAEADAIIKQTQSAYTEPK